MSAAESAASQKADNERKRKNCTTMPIDAIDALKPVDEIPPPPEIGSPSLQVCCCHSADYI